MDALWHTVFLGAGLAVVAVLFLWRARPHGASAFGFAWLALAATYPLAFRAGDLPANTGAPSDAYLFLWDLWWVRHALVELANPLFCDYLYHPHGTTLTLHGLALTQALATLPLQLALPGMPGHLLAFRAVVVLSFWLAGYAAYRLTWRVTRHRLGAILSGVAFTLSSFHFASTVRFHALAIEWLPLHLLALLAFLERGDLRRGVLLGLAAVGAFYAAIEYAYFLALASAILVLADVGARRRRGARGFALAPWLRSLPAVAAPLLLTLPFWWAFAAEARLTHASLAGHLAALTPDVLDLVLPSAQHPLLGESVRAARAALGMPAAAPAASLSWTLGVLAALGCALGWRRRDRALLPWLAIALLFGLLALGPSIYLVGRDTGLPGPYALALAVLPLFEQSRMPIRFLPLAQLALGVLAAYGLRFAFASRPAHRRPRTRTATVVGTLALAAVGLELWRAPLATRRVEVASPFERVQAPPGSAALIDWPPGVRETAEIEGLDQIVHQQRLVQDLPLFLPRAAEETRATTRSAPMRRLLRTLFLSEGLGRAEPVERARRVDANRRWMRTLDVRWVAVRRAHLDPDAYARIREAVALHRPEVIHEDAGGLLADFGPLPTAPEP